MQLKPILDAEEVSALWDEHFPQIRSGRDYAIVEIVPGGSVVRLTPDWRHLRPGGTISGPAIFTLADIASYAALLAHVGPEPLMVTTSCSVNFMRRAPMAPHLGRCRILKLGRRLAVADVGIEPESGGDLVAQATVTYSIPNAR